MAFFSIDTEKNQDLSYQKGAIRANCLDSLDRTNLFQSRVAWHVFTLILKREGLSNQIEDLMSDFNNMWADNADSISYIYSGTQSLNSNVTRFGKQGIAGKITSGFNSVKRFFKSNLGDDFKEQCSKAILGSTIFAPPVLSPNSKVDSSLSELNILVASWNIGGLPHPSSKEFMSWLRPTKDFIPYINY